MACISSRIGVMIVLSKVPPGQCRVLNKNAVKIMATTIPAVVQSNPRNDSFLIVVCYLEYVYSVMDFYFLRICLLIFLLYFLPAYLCCVGVGQTLE